MLSISISHSVWDIAESVKDCFAVSSSESHKPTSWHLSSSPPATRTWEVSRCIRLVVSILTSLPLFRNRCLLDFHHLSCPQKFEMISETHHLIYHLTRDSFQEPQSPTCKTSARHPRQIPKIPKVNIHSPSHQITLY